ncbi:MAG: peptidoglycan-binding protein, partial [Patescibacteria group bacterium]|nr:peptidoglycan-binding protein [Patescibacteria group bacterium]
MILNSSYAGVFSSQPDKNFPFVAEGGVKKVFYDSENDKLWVGGDFKEIRNYTGASAIFDLSNYGLISRWPKIEGQVCAIVSDGHGGWYVGGMFSKVNDLEIENLVHIFSDGKVDENFKFSFNSLNTDCVVYSLAISSSTLFIGGRFDKINNQPTRNLAAVDLNSNSLRNWNVDIDGQAVYSLALSSSTLYVGGLFDAINNASRFNLAAFNLSDMTLLPWAPRLEGGWGIINSLLVSSSTLYVGGSFEEINGQSRKNLASFDINTGELTAWNPEVEGEIISMDIDGDKIYVYGNFWEINGEPRKNLAVLDLLQGELLSWQPQKTIQDNFLLRGVVKVVGQNVYVGGWFVIEDDLFRREIIRENFAVFDKQNGSLVEFDPNFDGEVYAIASDGNKLYVGGYFNTVTIDKNKKYLINFLPDGKAMSVLENANGEISGDIYAIEKIDGKIFVSGSYRFDPRFGQNSIYFLKIFDSSNYSLIREYQTDGPIYSIAKVFNSIYAVGNFSHVNFQHRKNIVILDGVNYELLENDSLGFSENESEYFNLVKSIGQHLFIGGKFSKLAGYNFGVSKSRLVIFNLKNTETKEVQIDGMVNAIILDGRYLYLGGDFTRIFNVNRPYLAVIEVNSEGGLSLSEKLKNIYPNGPIYDLKVIGKNLYIGGRFTNISSQPRKNLAAIDLERDELLLWTPSIGGQVKTIDFSSSSLYIGGYFMDVNSSTLSNLARFSLLLPPQIYNVKLNNAFDNNSTFPANTTQVKLTFSTDKTAICRYSTIPNTPFGSMNNDINTSNNLDHFLTLSNLQNGTTYSYYVRCRDSVNPDLKSNEDYLIRFTVAQQQQSSVQTGSGGGGGFAVFPQQQRQITSTATTTSNDELIRLWLLQFILQRISTEERQIANQNEPAIQSIPPNYRFSRVLSLGMRGEDVRYLQIFLRNRGEKVNVTGIFDEETRQAVINFQEKYKEDILLPQGLARGTGRVAGYTIRKINELLGRQGRLSITGNNRVRIANRRENVSPNISLNNTTSTLPTTTIDISSLLVNLPPLQLTTITQ